jgi:hypothetical protein
LAHGEAIAIGRIWKRFRGHGQPLGDAHCTLACLARIYAFLVNAQTRCDNTSFCSGNGMLSNRGCAALQDLISSKHRLSACTGQ